VYDKRVTLVQVENLEDTLSINHNWLNACNLHWTFQLLRRDLADATAAIEGLSLRVLLNMFTMVTGTVLQS
jgi:hypothetical protein